MKFAPPNLGLLPRLWALAERYAGEDVAEAFLILLIALTGRTQFPVCARTVGNGNQHEELAMFVEQVLGRKVCRFLTSMTEAGVMCLGSKRMQEIFCLLYSGDWADVKLKRALAGLILGGPLRTLDGSSNGTDRYRAVDRRLSFILVRGDGVNEAELLSHVITIRLLQSAEHFRRKFRLRVGTEPTSLISETDFASIAMDLSQIPWGSEIQFRDDLFQVDSIADAHSLQRTTQLLGLASVWRLLASTPGLVSTPIAVTRADTDAILQLLASARVNDDRMQVTVKELEVLLWLQQNRNALMGVVRSEAKNVQKHSIIKVLGDATGVVPGPFTFYNVQARLPAPRLSIDTIRLRFLALANAGLLDRNGSIGARVAWDLTDRGRDFNREMLYDRLAGLLSQPHPNAPNASENPDFGTDSPGAANLVPIRPGPNQSATPYKGVLNERADLTLE